MSYPKIELKFDKELDVEMAWNFYSNQEFAGCNFWQERALKYHPKLKDIAANPDKKTFLKRYTLDFYNSHDKELKKLSKESDEYLDQTKGRFFSIADEIFSKHPWPQTEFTGFFSIFDFCPRFLNDGSFQVFIYNNRNMQLFTIYHEMLHFIFYDFAKAKFPELFDGLDTEDGSFWDLAEVFNVVLQDSDAFISLHGKIEDMGYPDHRELISFGKELWEKDGQDIQKWIPDMMKMIEAR